MPAAACWSIQPPPRNSTASVQPGSRCGSSRTYAAFASELTNQGGNWKRTAPSLPASASGARARAVQLPELLHGVLADVLAVGVLLGERLGGQRLAQPRGQALDARRVPGEQAVGLDVEDEAVRGARRPQLAVALGRRRVVGGVDLDDGELLGVVRSRASALVTPARVEAPAGDQRGVGPRTAAHQDARAHLGLRPSPGQTFRFTTQATLCPPRTGTILAALGV